MISKIKDFIRRIPSLHSSSKEPVVASQQQLAPPLTYFTMDVSYTSSDDYNDNSFFNDLDKIEKPYEVPKAYEEVQ